VLLLLLSETAEADDRFAGVNEYVASAMQQWEVPGVAVAAVQNGEVVFARGYGVCEIGDSVPVTEETVFSIASCAKSFIAASLAILVDEGRLEWDDPVVKHLPDFRLATNYLTDHVTIRDLLCHRTGLPRADLLGDRGDNLFEERFQRLRCLQPAAELRTQLIYNNHTFDVAARIVERVSGRSWEDFLQERVLQPLGMLGTVTSPAGVAPERLARRHWRPEGQVVARPPPGDGAAPSGGMYSSVTDLAKWINVQLAEGRYGGGQLLRPETVREMQSLQMSRPVLNNQPPNDYAARFFGAGLGWFVLDYRGRKLVYHGGSWGAWVAFVPEEQIGVAVLINVDLNGLEGMLMYNFLDALLVGPETAWDRGRWAQWLKNEGPEHSYRQRDEERKKLEEQRRRDTSLSLALAGYAGHYESDSFGRLGIEQSDGSLWVRFGVHTVRLIHWQHDEFYARTPTGLTYDWLLQFDTTDGLQTSSVMLRHIGYDAADGPQTFSRVAD
jgi:CubicO group peptidase (beta-lactamase class C family)